MTATDELRAMLDERGVEWTYGDGTVSYANDGHWCHAWAYNDDTMCVSMGYFTPQQAIAATLGPTSKPDPVWEKWHKSLRHETVETVGDAVEQLMYEAIEFGGDMGPNGNTCNGIDEGDVLTSGFINEWIARFESTLGRDRYSYEQLREISNAVGDAMEYAHDRAIEHPDRADPLWSLDEYVNRILKVAFEGEVTLGAGTCELHDCEGSFSAVNRPVWRCDCGAFMTQYTDATTYHKPRFCPNCGAKVVDE